MLGDTTGVDKSTVSRIVRNVSVALASLATRFITWPNEEESSTLKSEFYKMSGFPGVVGCIDGTHVKIQPHRTTKQLLLIERGTILLMFWQYVITQVRKPKGASRNKKC